MSTTRYELIDEKHGEGAFGKIQKRKDRILERLVAVKGLKLFEDEAARERFIKEAKTLAKLSHPHVPAIYDVEFLERESWQGDQEVRAALVDAAKNANTSAHDVISKSYLDLFETKDLKDTPGWYHHDVRKIVVALLANANCDTNAVRLAEFYDKLNLETH